MTKTIHHRLHILEAADWKAGVITLLEPGSPYRPWRYAFGETRPGDRALLVLGTDPVSVLTVLGRIDDQGGLDGCTLSQRHRLNLVDLTTLAMLADASAVFTDWRLDDEVAERMILALHESPVYGEPFYWWGHSSVAAARTLLHFGSQCHGCGQQIDLSESHAREQIFVHTTDPLRRPDPGSPIRPTDGPPPGRPYRARLRKSVRDWPAVLCRECDGRMRDGGFTSMVDFKFALHPECPLCEGKRTLRIRYGMPADPESWQPWLGMGGCCQSDEKWRCDLCGHSWA